MINLCPISSDVIDILGYLLLALIAVGFILCWVAMAISTVKAFQKKSKGKKKEKVKPKNATEKRINVKSLRKNEIEIEEARIDNSANAENMKREFS